MEKTVEGKLMSQSITEILYRWMLDSRIITDVAGEMGWSGCRLSAELRPGSQAKLGADELVALFAAIRRVGYEKELRGILHRFIAELKGDVLRSVADEDLVPQVLRLTESLGVVSSCASRISRMKDVAELKRIKTMLRTEALPVVLQMEDIVAARIQALQGKQTKVMIPVVLGPAASQTIK